MRLSDVLYQEKARDRLLRALSSRRVPHAYLFAGPEGVGKEMLALRLAALLLCGTNANLADGPGRAAKDGPSLFGSVPDSSLKPQATSLPSDPCGHCTDCTLLAAGNHPDFHRIHRSLVKMHPDAEVRKKKAIDLSIEVIRAFLLEPIGRRPTRGQSRVFVICEADRMNIASQNALLKTLEEPPGHSYLILLVPRADAVAATIRSRCQLIPFGTLPTAFVAEQLAARLKLPSDRARLLSEVSQGSLGTALRLSQTRVETHLPSILEALDMAAGDDPITAGKRLLEVAEEIAPEAENAHDDEEEGDTNAAREARVLSLALVSAVLRDIQRTVVRHPPAALAGEARLHKWAAATDARRIGQAIRAIALAEHRIEQNANKGLLFDSVGIALGDAFSAPATVR